MTPDGEFSPALPRDGRPDAFPPEPATAPAPSAKSQAGRAVREIVETLLLAALIFFLVRLVVLNFRVDGERHLPIWIGSYEAEAIAMELQGVTASRPLPYDLMRTIIDDMGGAVERIAVTDLTDDVFYARIVLRQNEREVEIDSRPSDAIALAVRSRVPILVADSVMEKAGVMLSADDDEGEGEADPTQPELERAEGVDEERLSVFRDFINSLDLDDFERKSGN